jgi:aminopeptidase N
MRVVRRSDGASEDGALILHGHASLDVVSVSCSSQEAPITWDRKDDSLTIRNLLNSDNTITIKTRFNPAGNSSLIGMYASKGGIYTQCEPEGFRKMIFYLDRPDNLAEFRVKLIGDRSLFPVLLSNGNKVDSGELHGNKHFAVFHDPFPKPSYLFAVVAGSFDTLHSTFKTKSNRDIKLGVYINKGTPLEQARHAMASIHKSMKWDEDVYGLEYDLDVFNIVAVNDFVFGAMENKGLNIFNAK